MLSYETLDTIADSYTPLLGAISLLLVASALIFKRWRLAGLRSLGICTGLIVAYGLMFLDDRYHIWPAVGLDYSTHTAVALVLVTYLAFFTRKLAAFWIVSLLSYFGLMLYQHYHTVADIVTTVAVVSIPMAVAYWSLYRIDERRNY